MYNQYIIQTGVDKEILIAFLEAAGFEAFEEQEEALLAFRLATEHSDALADLADINQQFPLQYSFQSLPDVNWNEEWEKNFSPIQIGEKLGIRATFHAPIAGVQQELVIDPKMAFGTGHHATTYMVSAAMFDYDFQGKSVLDYGCGTGVLAILAKRLGAGFTWAVDIERPSYENTLENAALNGVAIEKVTHGTLEDVDTQQRFDIILANINRNVILASLASLHQRMKPEALLFVSGILSQDAKQLAEAGQQAGFAVLKEQQRGDWHAWVFRKI